MRKFLITTAMVAAVAALGACNRGASNNTQPANKATANSAAPAAAPAPAAPGADPAALRTAVVDQCVQRARANPNIPAQLDLAGACGCATDATLSRPDALAYAQTPEGQQAFTQALAQCIQQRMGGMAPPAGAATDEEAEAEGAEETTE
jgi:hypothetical protein